MSNNPNVHMKRNIFGGVVGNILEWYDFAVFGFFAPIIGAQFFPSDNQLASLINVFGVFAAGYLMRPIGGTVFGHFGDKLGRKRALQLSVMMMAIPTTLLGFLPTHAQIGIAAPILLVLLRLVQGVSVGGELVGSISFITEIAPKNRRGFYGSFSVCSAVGGILLGSAVATAAHGLFDPQMLKEWGWRIPFMLGFAIGGFGLWMRKGMVETPEFEKTKDVKSAHKSPVIEVIKTMPGHIFHIVAILVVYAGGFYMLFVWWPTYLTTIVTPHISHALMINTISMVVLMFLIPATGLLSDIVGRKKVLAAAFFCIAVLAYPLIKLTDHGVFSYALISQLLFALVIAGAQGPMSATLVELFPTRIRFSGIGVSYNITLAIFGGTSPLVCTWLVSRTGDIAAPAYYLIIMAVVSFVATITLRRNLGGELEN